MPPRRGVLFGLGGIARQSHLPAFLREDGVRDRLEIVAAVDLGGPGVLPVAGIPLLRDISEVASLGPIDFIDICTPTSSHLDLTLWGLSQGYHVLCEKPVALTRGEVGRISDIANSRGRVVMACHQYRFNPAWRKVREWLEAGFVGRWHLAEFQVYRMAADAGTAVNDAPWRGSRDVSRGGVLLDHGTHLIYQLLDVAGMPSGVRGWTGRLRHHYDVEDTAQVLLEFEGRLGSFFLTWAADRRETTIRFTGDQGSIEWRGGLLRRSGRHGDETLDFSAELDKASYYRWFVSLFHRFADQIDQQDGHTSLEDISRVTRVLEAAYESANSGVRVTV